jgi:hypothetical protein
VPARPVYRPTPAVQDARIRVVSEVRQQGLIGAPRQAVRDVITDIERHPEWWPDTVEVECDEVGEGCIYREVARQRPTAAKG